MLGLLVGLANIFCGTDNCSGDALDVIVLKRNLLGEKLLQLGDVSDMFLDLLHFLAESFELAYHLLVVSETPPYLSRSLWSSSSS